MNTLKIELSYDIADHEDGEGFLQWLRFIGHDAFIGSSSGTFINGIHTASCAESSDIINKLWERFCNE